MAHGLGEGDAEALVVRRHHENVGRSEVGLELRAADRTRDVHGRGQPELLDERAQRRLVRHAERRADQVQAGSRVGETPQDVEHLDEVVRRLVGRNLPHVEQVGAALARFAPLQGGRELSVGLVALGVHVDQQRDDGGPFVAQGLEL